MIIIDRTPTITRRVVDSDKIFPMLTLTQLYNFLTLKGSFSAVSKPNVASKYALESSRRDLHNAHLCTVLESNPQKPGKTWKEKSLAKTTSGRDDQKKHRSLSLNFSLRISEIFADF